MEHRQLIEDALPSISTTFSTVLRKTACMSQVSHSTIHRWIVSPDRKQYSRRQRPKTDIVIGSNITVSLQLIRSVIKSIVEKRNNFIRNGHPFVSPDETSFGRNGAITRIYSKKGEPLFVKSKPSRMKTTSVLSAVSSECETKWSTRIGSFDRNTFLEALKSFSFERGTVVLLDNDQRRMSTTQGYSIHFPMVERRREKNANVFVWSNEGERKMPTTQTSFIRLRVVE